MELCSQNFAIVWGPTFKMFTACPYDWIAPSVGGFVSQDSLAALSLFQVTRGSCRKAPASWTWLGHWRCLTWPRHEDWWHPKIDRTIWNVEILKWTSLLQCFLENQILCVSLFSGFLYLIQAAYIGTKMTQPPIWGWARGWMDGNQLWINFNMLLYGFLVGETFMLNWKLAVTIPHVFARYARSQKIEHMGVSSKKKEGAQFAVIWTTRLWMVAGCPVCGKGNTLIVHH